jgi:UDP-N-acetylmuramoyl-L-alanyl-D-glutamate--2,6-diaminopimelate ligase
MHTALTSPTQAARWLGERVRGSLRSDSRQVRAGDGFVAWPGHHVDARRFVPAALHGGAAACLVDADGIDAFAFDDDARIASLPRLQQRSGVVAAAFHGDPSQRLDVLASTGTNGKTSTTWWIAQALGTLGRRCAVLGTLGVGEPPHGSAAVAAPLLSPTGLTTPDAVTLQQALRTLLDAGVSACAIEASSIGLHQHRLAGTRIKVALFTNLTLDHLDYHGTMAAYWAAKRTLFAWPALRSAVLNVDDAHGASLAAELASRKLQVWTCSAQPAMQKTARLAAAAIGYVDGGLAFDVHEGDDVRAVRSRLLGDFNVGNLLLVIGALRALDVPLADAVASIATLGPVPGRMQRIAGGAQPQPEAVIDYAHTPDALEKVLRALRPFADARGGRLWCVFGCGGNRDAGKRPLMGEIAERLADRVLLTDDNPRDEPAASILAQIVAGIARPDAVQLIGDRRAAIEQALQAAAAEDVVLIAGKGHESTQEIGGVKHAFSDLQVAKQALLRRAGSEPC